jgi:hypothetical protein
LRRRQRPGEAAEHTEARNGSRGAEEAPARQAAGRRPVIVVLRATARRELRTKVRRWEVSHQRTE